MNDIQTPILFTSLGRQSDPYRYGTYGMALLDQGICQIDAINGVGLLTRGFIWQGPAVWFDPQSMYGVSTNWSAAAGYSGNATLYTTGWTAAIGYAGSATTYATTWVKSQSFGSEF